MTDVQKLLDWLKSVEAIFKEQREQMDESDIAYDEGYISGLKYAIKQIDPQAIVD